MEAACDLAAASPLASLTWTGRGRAPLGYIKGMAVMFAACYARLGTPDTAVASMTVPVGSTGRDALARYGVAPGGKADILRSLFALLIGLGMRESSGNYTEGRDTTADNVTADTAEAGLFQQSWNSSAASPATSGSDDTFDVTTGVPLAIASSGGRPNPS